MAFEQMMAYLEGRSQEELGPTNLIGPDRFPLLESSELKDEHELVTYLIETTPRFQRQTITKNDAMYALAAGDKDHKTKCFQAVMERAFAYDAKLAPRSEDQSPAGISTAKSTLLFLIHEGADLDAVAIPTLRYLTIIPHGYGHELVVKILKHFERKYASGSVPEECKELMIAVRSIDYGDYLSFHEKEHNQIIDPLIGDGIWKDLMSGEVWSDRAISHIRTLPEEKQSFWRELFRHCQTAKSAKPNSKWTAKAEDIMKNLSDDEFKTCLIDWFDFLDKGRSKPVLLDDYYDESQRVHSKNGNILRGLIWLCIARKDLVIMRSITKVALSAYRKARGIGPRAVKVGNAAVYSLGEMADVDAVGQLAILKVRVKFGTAQKGIEKALVTTAERVGIPRDELEEMSVPAYGLTGVGLREEQLGTIKAQLAINGPKTELKWFKEDGKQQKSVPAEVKKVFADDLKELKQAMKDIDKMLPAQSARIEQLYLQQKKWSFNLWKERYHDHPLVGTLARRLIWTFSSGDQCGAGIYRDGRFVTSKNAELDLIGNGENVEVTLWHPIDETTGDIVAWREFLIENEIKQPFKQAHREVYLLTDAERSTNVYSNRFAAHILKQHQFNALCGARGWKNTLRLMVDDSFPPAHNNLDVWGLRAEFWVEGIGDEYGQDTNETGTFHYLATDQVRFYSQDAADNYSHAYLRGFESSGTDRDENHPLELEKIPSLVFSEVMRDVDLFVGVASVGNDPAWSDGGPQGRYRDYWNNYSFGELGVTSELRKAVLSNLIPRLKIADRCTFSDRFLIVRGDIRTYKIHLGSGNILMEPTDQYLCIVRKQSVSKAADRVFLPFEGDTMLSIILSKAFLLADDRKIKDSSIVNQIKSRATV